MLLLRPDTMTLAGLPGRIGFPGYSLTLVAKATLRLVPGGTAELLDESLPLTGDDPPLDPDGPSPSPPLMYASDLVPAKPVADVLVVGSAHAPGGRATQRLTAGVRVGGLSRRVTVTGDRFWKQGLLSSSMSQAAMFESMPLSAERAFGGAGFKANPAGKGAAVVQIDGDFKARPVPNIELEGEPMSSPRSKPQPAVLGPIPSDWPARASLMKGFKGDYLKTRWPALPAGFDFAYFQAADPAQRVAGFLQGDETIELSGMHPEHEVISTKLPGLRVRAIVRDLSKPEGARDREVEMKLDTLWLHGEELLATVVWRGVTTTADEYFEELESAFAVFEPVSTRASAEALSRSLDQTMRDRREPLSDTAADAPETSSEPNEHDADGSDDAEQASEEAAELADPPPPLKLDPAHKAAMASALTAEGMDASVLEDDADEAADEGEDGSDDAEVIDGWTRSSVEAAAAEPGSLVGSVLDGLDLSGLDLSGVSLDGARMIGTKLRGAKLAGASIAAAVLERANLDDANLSGAVLAGSDLTAASLVRANAKGAVFESATFDRARLDGAVLDSVKGAGASFEHASLAEASLAAADFTESTFENADLTDVRAQGVVLEAASLQDAKGPGMCLDRGSLAGLKAEGLVAPKASFVAAEMGGAWFEGAQLPGADFRYAQLADGGFARCVLDDADLSAAVLRRCFLLKAKARRARFVQSDLFEAILEKADLSEADLSGANVYCAELLDAKLAGCRLASTNLGRTKAEGLAT